jgi:hypothetical protein
MAHIFWVLFDVLLINYSYLFSFELFRWYVS